MPSYECVRLCQRQGVDIFERAEKKNSNFRNVGIRNLCIINALRVVCNAMTVFTRRKYVLHIPMTRFSRDISSPKRLNTVYMKLLRRKVSFGMLRHMALVRTDVSEELGAFIIRTTGMSELGTLAVTSNRRTLRRNWYFFAAYVGC
jgi:hypothetical protein